MPRFLKFCGALMINLVAAIIGTAFLDGELLKVIPTRTVDAMVWREIILDILCAAFLGFFMWRTWRSSAIKWIWVPAALWFVLGYLSMARGPDVFGRLFGFGSRSVFSTPQVTDFFAFTVPFIRATFYSIGAYASSLVYRANVGLPDGR